MSFAERCLHRAGVLLIVVSGSVAWCLLPDGVCIDDGGDFQVAAITLGIQHPPGYPLLTLAAHPFTWLPLGKPAFGVTLFNWMAGIAVLLLTSRCLMRLGVRPLLRVTVLLGLIAWRPFWDLWASPDVYMSFLLMIVAMTWAALCLERGGGLRHALLAAAMLGCILATRNSAVMYLPGIALGAWAITRRRRRAGRTIRFAGAAGIALAGVLPILIGVGYLWLRDAPGTRYNYLTQWGEGTNEFSPSDFSAGAKWRRLTWLVGAEQYWVRVHMEPAGVWFRWKRALAEADSRQWFMVMTLAAAASYGAATLWRRRVMFVPLMGFVFFGEAVLLSTYVIEEQWTFLLPITWALVMLAAGGAERLLRRIAAENSGIRNARALGCAALVIACACGCWSMSTRWGRTAGPLGDQLARQPRWEALPRDSVIIVHWAYHAPLQYGRLVIGQRPDVHVVSPPMETWPLPGLPASRAAYYLPMTAGHHTRDWGARPEHGLQRLVRYAGRLDGT